jgi:hypothetical protein
LGDSVDLRRLIGSIFDPWVIAGALFFGVTLLAATMLLLLYTRPAPATAELPPTAVVTVISLPTATPVPPTATPPGPVTPTPSPLPLPPPGVVAVGAFVQIAGTGVDGLRLRVEPGLESDVRMLGLEAEVFQVQDGPREVDGYTWWYLVAPVDETRNGWAVSNYLAVVQNP